MGWYSSVADFAADQISGRARDPRSSDGDANSNFLLSGYGQAGPEPEHRTFETMAPLLAIPSRLNTGAIDRVYTAFDVSQPVGQPEDLCGRDVEVKSLLSGVLRRRNHGVVSGPRGSGKTSLVRVFSQYADREGVVVLYSACDDGTSFGDLIRSYLEQIPPSMVDPDSIELFGHRVQGLGADSSPYQATGVLAMLKYSQLVIVLDEFDRMTDGDMHGKISSLLKLVSDARLSVRFVLVGGSSAIADIVRAHPSLMRHVTSVCTAPLSSEAIDELLDRCAERCGIRFSDSAKSLINDVACGSPYHARLFGMHGALNARAAQADEVNAEHVDSGFEDALDEWSMLNPIDARVFREILKEEHGPTGELVFLARQVASQGAGQPSSGPPTSMRREAAGEKPDALSRLSETIRMVDGHACFRDATAPQFLLALDHVRQTVPHRMKGGKRA